MWMLSLYFCTRIRTMSGEITASRKALAASRARVRLGRRRRSLGGFVVDHGLKLRQAGGQVLLQ